MAKKTKLELDDFSFDRSLDVPDFDYELKPPKDTRKPIEKVGSGLKEGFKAVAFSNSFAKSFVKNALPRGYGSAYDLAEKSATSIKSLYDDTTREIRPFMNDLKRTTARLLPKVEDAMPKKVAEMVKDWTKTADARPGSTNYNPREAEISQQMAGLVKAQALLQQKKTDDDLTKDRLREGLEQVRHRDKLKQMDSMRMGIAQLVQYQNNVTSNYHRKSLELQYRHYFVAVDALEEAKRANAEVKQALALIVHNTALPEQVKLKMSDTFKDMAKRTIGGAIGGAIFGRSHEFTGNLLSNLKKTTMGRVQNVLTGGRTGLDMVNQLLDAEDMKEALGMKTDPHHAAGMLGGGFLAALLGEYGMPFLAPLMSKIPGIKRGGNKLGFHADNLAQILNERARSNKGVLPWGPRALNSFLSANIRMSSRQQTEVQKDTVANLGEPSYFSRQNAKTLNEIIPGYLARILQELQITRTGNTSTELTHYDFTKNRFDTQTNVRRNAFNSLIRDSDKKWTTEDIENLVSEVDKKGKLTPEQRRAFGQQILRNNISGRLQGVEVLGKAKNYDGSASQHADTFAKMVSDYFANDPHNERRYSFANKANRLGSYAGVTRSGIQDFANLGMTDFLHDAGLIDEKGERLNLDNLHNYYYDKNYTPSGSASAPPNGSMSRPRRRSRQTHQPFMGDQAGRDNVSDSLSNKLLATIHVDAAHIDRNTAHLSDMLFEPKQKPSVLSGIHDTLIRIEERMEKGLPTMVVGDVASGDIPKEAMGSGGKTKWWWQKSILDAAKSAGKGAWGAARGIGGAANWLVGGSFRNMFAGAGLVTGLAGKAVNKAADKLRGFRDVYTEGERNPVLFAHKLKAGDYFDAKTGKPIRSWHDITGAVVDESGIVMTDEQARTAYVKDGLVKKGLKALGASIRGLTAAGNWLGGGIFKGGLNAFSILHGASSLLHKGLSHYMNGPQDVYVRDKEHPKRLRKALDARTMRAGGYSSAVDDKPIRSPKDIAGEVYNYKGVTVLDEDEFKGGLFDKNGNPIRTGVSRLLGGVGKIASLGLKAAGFLTSGVNKGIGNLFGMGKGLMSGFAGLFGHHGLFFGGGKKLMDTVTEIRDILDSRLPVQKKIRKGSIADQHRQRKEKEEEEARKARAAGTGDGKKSGGLLGMLAGLLHRKKSGDEEGGHTPDIMDDVEQGLAQSVGDRLLGRFGKWGRKIPGIGRLFGRGAAGAVEGAVAHGVEDAGVKAAENAAKKGLMARLGGAAGFGLKGLGWGLGLGTAGSVANAMGHDTIGAGLNYAGDAANIWGGLGAAGSLLGVEGGALGMAGAIGGAALTGLGALLASPVLVPGLIAAGIGGLGYAAYKWANKNKLSPLAKVRYAQYGWKPEDNNYVDKVFGLEAALMDGVIFQGDVAQIDGRKVQKATADAIKAMGVDMKNPKQMGAFSQWYYKRFKPVFITHVTVLHRLKPGVKLEDVDSKLSADEKQKYLTGIQGLSDVYNVAISPIPDSKLSAGPSEVAAVFADVKKDIDKKTEKDQTKKPEEKKPDQKSWFTKAGDAISNAWDKTKKLAGDVGSGIKEAAKTAGSLVAAGAGAVAAGAGAAYNATKNVVQSAGNTVSNAVQTGTQAAKNMAAGAGDALSKGYQAAKSGAMKLASAAGSVLTGGMSKLASLIARGEGTYSIANAPNGRGSYKVAKGVDVSKMTIAEIMKAQASRQIFAVGRYQMIPDTLADGVKKLGISTSETFTPAIQDKLFSQYLVGIKRPPIAAYLSGKSNNVKAAALAAAQEWASIGTPAGVKTKGGAVSDGTLSYYSGIGGNKASISSAEIVSALEAAKGGGAGDAGDNGAASGTSAAGSGDSGSGAKAPSADAQAYAMRAAHGSRTSTGDQVMKANGIDPEATMKNGKMTMLADSGTPSTSSDSGSKLGPPSLTGASTMKVADQTPGPVPAASGQSSNAAMFVNDAAGPVNNSGPAPSPDSTPTPTPQAPDPGTPLRGFTNRNSDLAAQGQYQNDQLSKSLGPIGDVLQQSLDVQKQMRDALLMIAKSGGLGAGAGPRGPTPTGNLSPEAQARKQPTPLVTPPVSMSKSV